MKKQIRVFVERIAYKNDFLFNSYRRLRKDHNHYILDLFEKKKYQKLNKQGVVNYEGGRFYYYINPNIKCISKKHIIDNIPISYKTIVYKPLNEILDAHWDKVFVTFVREFFNEIRSEVLKSSSKGAGLIASSIDNLFIGPANDLRDALQRILFINQLLWQTGHRLNGLGRLDVTLDKVYKESRLTNEETKGIIKDFLKVLNKDYGFKSNVLRGDTGQIITLGGLNPDGSYFCNDLTYLFIDCVKELKLPDPKTLLRVSEKMPDSLLERAVESIKTGCGSPLLSNDDVVVFKLADAGYSHADACNYSTSACWEPLCDGSSFEQNNIGNINFVKPLNDLLSKTTAFDSFESLLVNYEKQLMVELESIVSRIGSIEFAPDPLLSAFVFDCLERKEDISNGGAKYSNFGLLSVGLSNTIDSLLNIQRLVYEEKKYNLSELENQRRSNFPDDNLLSDLKNNGLKFGNDNILVIELTNRIIRFTSDFLKGLTNKFGGIYRFGLSSPNYISSSVKINASLDGRQDFEPFNVHISSSASVSYTELINFSSLLEYGNRNINGNVCDLIVAPSFIDNNFDKFVSLLKVGIKQGFFQMQFNVIDSKTLIEAKKNPELFRWLIVRVWGFSAYFIELPESYQNLIIKRALLNESLS